MLTNLIENLLTTSRAAIPLEPAEAEALSSLRASAIQFFGQDEETKLRHGSADFRFGYRPFGRQHSVSPDRPDMNDSFAYWADDPALVPDGQAETVRPFLDALHQYWAVVTRASRDILTALAEHFAYTDDFDFTKASYIEVDFYLTDVAADLLQDRHEDGHLITLARSDGPGLEVEQDGRMVAAQVPHDHLLVMSGSILTAMTAGQIAPLYHQVRNHHLEQRITVLFLVNPPVGQSPRPYVFGDDSVDIGAMVRDTGAMFGLPSTPVLNAPEGPC